MITVNAQKKTPLFCRIYASGHSGAANERIDSIVPKGVANERIASCVPAGGGADGSFVAGYRIFRSRMYHKR